MKWVLPLSGGNINAPNIMIADQVVGLIRQAR